MKKNFVFILMTVMANSLAMAQEYVPFVREGVKWVYYCDNPFAFEVFNMPSGRHYYCFELTDDMIINGREYKAVALSHYLDGGRREAEPFIPVYLREEDKRVYAIHLNELQYPQCPVGINSFIGYPDDGINPPHTSSDEFVLYDFNDPTSFYDSILGSVEVKENVFVPCIDLVEKDAVQMGKDVVCRYNYETVYGGSHRIIEGIGYDGDSGMPLFYFERMIPGFKLDYALSHVVLGDRIIYKGSHYDKDISVGIDEAVADKTAAINRDENYYDLMGRNAGRDVPSAPGIYIRQGKKIVVR